MMNLMLALEYFGQMMKNLNPWFSTMSDHLINNIYLKNSLCCPLL